MTIFLYTVAAMWAVGTFVLMCYFITSSCYGSTEKLLATFIGFPIWVLIGLAPIGLIKHETSLVLATLQESDWRCTSAHAETTYVMVGKVLTPLASTVCDSYGRK